ncbi:hypothetical protein ACIXMR_07025 [Bacteroides fragilis]
MEATEGREILKYEYVQIYTNGYGNIVLLLKTKREAFGSRSKNV